MYIDFTCSGGFANLHLSYRADTEKLPADLAEKLEHLVEEAGIMNVQPQKLPASSNPPDVFVYCLFICKNQRQQSLSFNDMTAPEAFQPLLALLRELALEERKR
jgi:hypothetical protein